MDIQSTGQPSLPPAPAKKLPLKPPPQPIKKAPSVPLTKPPAVPGSQPSQQQQQQQSPPFPSGGVNAKLPPPPPNTLPPLPTHKSFPPPPANGGNGGFINNLPPPPPTNLPPVIPSYSNGPNNLPPPPSNLPPPPTPNTPAPTFSSTPNNLPPPPSNQHPPQQQPVSNRLSMMPPPLATLHTLYTPPAPLTVPSQPQSNNNNPPSAPPPLFTPPPLTTPPPPLTTPPSMPRPMSPPPTSSNQTPSPSSTSHIRSHSQDTTPSNNFRNSTDLLSPFMDQPEIYPQTRISEENFNYLKDIFSKLSKRSHASTSCSREGNSLAEGFKNYGTMLISQSDNMLGQCMFKIGDFQRDYETFRDQIDIQALSGVRSTIDQFINRDMKVVRASRKNFDKIKSMYESVDSKVQSNATKGKGINLVKQAELQQERDFLKGRVYQVGQESLTTIKLVNESNSVEIMEQVVEYMETVQALVKGLNEQLECLQPTIQIYKKESQRRKAELEKTIESQKPMVQSPTKDKVGMFSSELEREVQGEDPKKARLRRFIAAERNYVSSLNTLVSVYLSGLRTDDRLFSKVFKEDEVAMFSNIEPLYSNQTKFLEELENCLKGWGETNTPSLGAVFFRFSPKVLQLYSVYVNNFSKALVTIGRCKQSKNFQAFLKTCEEKSDGADLDSLIPQPLMRVTNYLIFLQELKEALSVPTSTSADQAELKHVLGALEKIQSVSELVEQSQNLIQLSKIQQSLTGYDSTLVEEGRFLIKEGTMSMTFNNNPSGQISSFYFILLSDLLIYCKKQNALFPISFSELTDAAGGKMGGFSSGSKYKYIGKFDLKNMDIKQTTDTDETKNSFQILCSGGVNCTLSCETKSQKEEWIALITKNISKCNQNKLFGIPLEQLMQRPTELGRPIPFFLQRIVDYLYEHGCNEEGIFRLSANQKTLDLAREEIETGVELDYSEMDIHAVAGILKLWVRNLPEPLLTWKQFETFVDVAEIEGKQQKYVAIKSILEKIPHENRFCCYYLMKLLTKVSENSSVNKMTPNNISIVFATLLLKKKDSSPLDCTSFNTIFGVIECFMTGFTVIFPEIEKQYLGALEEQSNAIKRKSVIPAKPLPVRPELSSPNQSRASPNPSLNSSASNTPTTTSNDSIEWTKQTFDESDSEDEGFSIGGSKQVSITIQLGEIVKQGYLTKKGAMRRNWTKRWFVLKQSYLFYFKTSKDKKPKGIIQLVNVSVTRSYYKPNCMAIRSLVDKDEREFLICASSQSELEDWINNITKCLSKEN
eukprot:gene416-526_t